MSAAGPPQGARPLGGAARSAARGGRIARAREHLGEAARRPRGRQRSGASRKRGGTATSRLPADRWRAIEIVFWLVALAAFFVFPTHRVLGSQILITGLFAVTLDLILGYAGIVSLGHAAFFGIGAYAAGVLAVHGWGEPF